MRRLKLAIRERFPKTSELLNNFRTEEQGQDITEYTLLIAFVVFAAAALFLVSGTVMGNIWGDANSILKEGDLRASGS